MAEQNKKIYPKGMRWQGPRDKAPSFVKGRLGLFVPDLTNWMNQHANAGGWVNLDVLEGRDGLYAVLNTYEPKPKLQEQSNDADDLANSIPF